MTQCTLLAGDQQYYRMKKIKVTVHLSIPKQALEPAPVPIELACSFRPLRSRAASSIDGDNKTIYYSLASSEQNLRQVSLEQIPYGKDQQGVTKVEHLVGLGKKSSVGSTPEIPWKQVSEPVSRIDGIQSLPPTQDLGNRLASSEAVKKEQHSKNSGTQQSIIHLNIGKPSRQLIHREIQQPERINFEQKMPVPSQDYTKFSSFYHQEENRAFFKRFSHKAKDYNSEDLQLTEYEAQFEDFHQRKEQLIEQLQLTRGKKLNSHILFQAKGMLPRFIQQLQNQDLEELLRRIRQGFTCMESQTTSVCSDQSE